MILSSVASRAVRKSTGASIRLATSNPSRSGSITSSTTRSGEARTATSTASSPSAAVRTSNPEKRRLAESRSLMLGSSSTTMINASGFVTYLE